MTVDLYDYEIPLVEKVLNVLNQRAELPRDQEDFRREIIERFEEIGLVVNPRWWSTNVPGVYIPDVDIVDRCTPLKHGFDFERQSYDVVNDTLGIEPEKKGRTFEFNPDKLHDPKFIKE